MVGLKFIHTLTLFSFLLTDFVCEHCIDVVNLILSAITAIKLDTLLVNAAHVADHAPDRTNVDAAILGRTHLGNADETIEMIADIAAQDATAVTDVMIEIVIDEVAFAAMTAMKGVMIDATINGVTVADATKGAP